VGRGVFDGLAFLWRDRLLRTLLLGEAVLVLGLGLIQVARVPLVESFSPGQWPDEAPYYADTGNICRMS